LEGAEGVRIVEPEQEDRMARTIWKGNISFGLVNIPVGLYTAESRDEIHFHLLDRKNMTPIHYKRVDEKTGKEVAWEDTVRGYELDDGRYVVVSDSDLKRANPEATQTIEITDFVDLAEISPLYFDKPYYLGPTKKADKSYRLLRETLRRTGKAGIAQVVIRTKQYLAAVAAVGDVIVLNLLRYAHELRDSDDLDLPTGKEGLNEKELKMAEQLVDSMVTKWDPDRYNDAYRDDVLKMIQERAKAGQLEKAPAEGHKEKPAPGGAKVIDLMALLQRSLEQGGKGKGTAKGTARSAATKEKPARTKAARAKPAKAAKAAPARKAAAKPRTGRTKRSA
jgi:DNA end-binding protein Ku